jgi:hypothetical protein
MEFANDTPREVMIFVNRKRWKKKNKAVSVKTLVGNLHYRDKIKKEFCIQNNISYIEISYKEFENINKILKEKIWK